MNAGQLQSLKDLIEFLKQQKVGEFDLEQGDLKVHLSFLGHAGAASHGERAAASQAAMVPAPPAPAVSEAAPQTASAPVPTAASSAASEETGLHIVKSPIVGTFYESSAPGADPFIKVGDKVEAGQVICIVEAMKLMNEIECDAAGEVVKRLVSNGQPVEYGQALFAIRSR